VGAVEVDGKTLKATVSDKFGNVSKAFESKSPYSFDNAVRISAADFGRTFDATAAKYRYTLAEGTYGVNLTGFTAGDEIVFEGRSAPAIAITNLSGSDGKLALSANYNGANVIDVGFSSLASADDSLIYDLSSFKAAFGSTSLAGGVDGSITKDVIVSPGNAGTGFDASLGNFEYLIEVGDYSATISGFGRGDSLSFFGESNAGLSVTNVSRLDGVINITGTLNKQAVDVTLIGLASELDSQVFGVDSFNSVYGAGSLVS
jgi:hypothetical protein